MSKKQEKEARATPSKKPRSWKKRLTRSLVLTLVPPIAEKWMKWFDYTALKDNERLLTLQGHEELLSHVRERKSPVILALWHNRLAFGPTAYQYCRGRGAYIMVSRSFDGEVISAVLERFKNMHAVRGGSAGKSGQDKGGQEALERLIEISQEGYDIAITPDGPQGPLYKVKRGVIDLASATGLPVFPVSANADRVLVAKSWDRTRVPFPYARFIYRVGKTMRLPKDASEELKEEKRLELERELHSLTEYVDGFFQGQKKR